MPGIWAPCRSPLRVCIPIRVHTARSAPAPQKRLLFILPPPQNTSRSSLRRLQTYARLTRLLLSSATRPSKLIQPFFALRPLPPPTATLMHPKLDNVPNSTTTLPVPTDDVVDEAVDLLWFKLTKLHQRAVKQACEAKHGRGNATSAHVDKMAKVSSSGTRCCAIATAAAQVPHLPQHMIAHPWLQDHACPPTFRLHLCIYVHATQLVSRSALLHAATYHPPLLAIV